MPDVVRSLHQRLPGSPKCASKCLPDDDPIAALLDDRLDVALVTKLDRRRQPSATHELFDDELRAVVNARHPLAPGPTVSRPQTSPTCASCCATATTRREPRRAIADPARRPSGPADDDRSGPDLLIETVATSDAVTVMPSWVVAPYLVSHEVVSLAVGDPPQRRRWYSATRPERSDLVDTFVAMMHSHLAGDAPRARVSLTA